MKLRGNPYRGGKQQQYAQGMTNERNLLGNRSASATWVRTAVVLMGVAIVLIVIGGSTATFGVAIVGGVLMGVGFIAGIVGVATSR